MDSPRLSAVDVHVSWRKQHGLALIEALLVFVIISLLFGVVVFAVSDITTKPVAAHACANEARRFEDALTSYRGKHNIAPTADNPNAVPLVAQLLRQDGDLADATIRYYGRGDKQWWYAAKGSVVVRGVACT